VETNKIISQIKAIFQNILPKYDKRCKIQPIEFITALVCSLSDREGRVTSVSSLRHSVMSITGQTLSRGTFWERVATKKIVSLLLELLQSLMTQLCAQMDISHEILRLLKVKNIFLVDSSSFSLKKGAKDVFPGPRNNVIPASAKVHGLYNLFKGSIQWFKITPATVHDRKGFPPLEPLGGSLVIFDLGYWDYQLLQDMISTGVFFLSRVKCNAAIKIIEVVEGISSSCIGLNHNCDRLASFRGNIVEFNGELKIQKTGRKFTSRVIGFWSTEDCKYHWYITNLKVSSSLMYNLYRLRWQLEILWKSWKSFLKIDEITTSDKNVIQCIILAGMCASLISGTVGIAVTNEGDHKKKDSFSIQNSSKMFIKISRYFYNLICTQLRGTKNRLLKSIKIFAKDMHDPNYRTRKNAIGELLSQMAQV